MRKSYAITTARILFTMSFLILIASIFQIILTAAQHRYEYTAIGVVCLIVAGTCIYANWLLVKKLQP